MSEQAIRFGVRSALGHRAATWKLWTPGAPKHDVYLACRELKGELKASLHQSGKWHIAFTPGFYERSFEEDSSRPTSRFTDRWPRPHDIAPGITLAFRVVVPWFSTTIIDEEKEGILWVTSAVEGYAIEFAVFITSNGCIVTNWPGKNSMNSKFVGSIPLFSGETIWVVHTTTPIKIPAPMQGKVRFFKGANSSTLELSELRAIIFGDEPDGSRVMYDVPVTVQHKS